MSEKFVASSGIEINVFDGAGDTYLVGSSQTTSQHARMTEVTASEEGIQSLREFFQHERDTELGRWRWPENPNYVVYPVGNGLVDVLRESSMTKTLLGPGRLQGVSRELAGDYRADASRHFYDAAAAYFAAHPEPKPWHSPDVGDFWALHIAHGMALSDDMSIYKFVPWMGGRPRYVPQSGGSVLDATDPSITAGRRIWPEVVSDDS